MVKSWESTNVLFQPKKRMYSKYDRWVGEFDIERIYGQNMNGRIGNIRWSIGVVGDE